MTFAVCRKRQRSGGFTLIELLVVISIIAILIGLLLPALSAAQTVAITAKCLANQHQLAVGMAAYESDNRGAVPGVQAQGVPSHRACGELGVQYFLGENSIPGAGFAPYWGWSSGAMIYGSFEQAISSQTTFATRYPYTGNGGSTCYLSTIGGVTTWGNDFVDGVTAWDAPNPTPGGSTIYSAPIGLGYVGQYLSPTGTADETDGRIFYDPGVQASFSTPAYLGDPYLSSGGCDSITNPRNNQTGNGLYTTFQSDWNQKAGKGHGTNAECVYQMSTLSNSTYYNYQATNVNPYVYSTYIYRSGCYYDTVDTSNGEVYSNINIVNWGRGQGWSNWYSEQAAYPTGDSPYLNGKCFAVCNSPYSVNAVDSDTTWPGREAELGDIAHKGQVVNRAFHDGSARTMKVPLGHLPPCDSPVSSGMYQPIMAPPGILDSWGAWWEGATILSYGFGSGGYTSEPTEWPYMWAVLDGNAPWPAPAAGW